MGWIKIDGKEEKPLDNIIVRHFVVGDKKGTYHDGWYDVDSCTYKIYDEPPIEQDRLTHYIILEEPKDI